MTKRAQIEKLYWQGKNVKEVIVLTGFGYGYVHNIFADIKKPGILNEASKRYLETENGRESRRVSKKRNPKLRAHLKQSLVSRHQGATMPKARNYRQRWTMKEIEYLTKHGGEQTIHHLALELGRTYLGVQMAAQTHGVDLRGNKMGKEAVKFKGIYKEEIDQS